MQIGMMRYHHESIRPPPFNVGQLPPPPIRGRGHMNYNSGNRMYSSRPPASSSNHHQHQIQRAIEFPHMMNFGPPPPPPPVDGNNNNSSSSHVQQSPINGISNFANINRRLPRQ